MKLLAKSQSQLVGRFAPDAVAIECNCGVHMLWERGNGKIVYCPSCGRAQEMDLDAVHTVEDPALKTKPGQMFVG